MPWQRHSVREQTHLTAYQLINPFPAKNLAHLASFLLDTAADTYEQNKKGAKQAMRKVLSGNTSTSVSSPSTAQSHPVDLEHFKRAAKRLLKAAQANEQEALERMERVYPGLTANNLKLAYAQHTIAREHGFNNWAKLKENLRGNSVLSDVSGNRSCSKSSIPIPKLVYFKDLDFIALGVNEWLTYERLQLFVHFEQDIQICRETGQGQTADINERKFWRWLRKEGLIDNLDYESINAVVTSVWNDVYTLTDALCEANRVALREAGYLVVMSLPFMADLDVNVAADLAAQQHLPSEDIKGWEAMLEEDFRCCKYNSVDDIQSLLSRESINEQGALPVYTFSEPNSDSCTTLDDPGHWFFVHDSQYADFLDRFARRLRYSEDD